ncbi:hypothetical protein OUZ56_021875 [Daphnia magna]|uniref:Uncharacterized protein n=1 Tax=Daphnia magna TaxID=35525 RepID=A0ABR0AUQ0_9CRUS|nr:hypothetical protein OUZ56_021875 [Daphnia magna]
MPSHKYIMTLKPEMLHYGFPFFKKSDNFWHIFKAVDGKGKIEIVCKAAIVNKSENFYCRTNLCFIVC